ncbi:restriction endonuclease subunit S [Vibrio ostreicida]|uniref:Restriction endonuclease subunit S n=1 Tax=Vibrio ostreicida TaxID=526588 RepID=A0ABT8BP99_9VIBR|nr:restriction endonuclease subunit S [Vibrio ostreicida]MDN3608925.1 restriction endonuclease subunit S [Vibrio ostreicida]NPD09959.1 restriction endonuclease subunit S [Vibrio ostreicida]
MGKYQEYPEYRGSDIGWLEAIPSHWLEGRVKHISSNLDYKRIPLSAEERGNRQGEYPYYGASGVIDKVDDYLFDEETILFGEDGANLLSKSTPLAFLASGKYWVNNHAHILKPLDGIYSFWVNSLNNLDISAVVSGSAQPKLTAEALGNLAVVYPPSVEERQKIANFLDHETAKIDILIEKQQQLIKLLKEKRQAVISHAVTKGLNSEAQMKDSGVEWLGEVPEHWVVTPLAGVADVVDPNPSHRNPKYTDDGFPFISTVEFTGVDDVETNTPRRVAEETVLEQEKRCNFQEGSIAFSRKGTIGAVRILPHNIRFALLDSVCVINCGERILHEFLYQQCRSSLFESQLGAETRGAALKQVSVGRVRGVKTFLPPLNEQTTIVTYLNQALSKLDKTMGLANKQVSFLRERRTALVSAAVTGKIDVRNWQAPEQVSKQQEAG